MTTQIVIHVLPYEIDQLEQILILLKKSSKYLSSDCEILVDVVLNVNLNDWDKSILPKEFFVDKFNQLEQLTKTWSLTNFKINNDESILGCVSYRRKVFKETQADNILILDTDITFSDSMLYHLINGSNIIKDITPYYILTPQIPKMWDDSWDCIVNNKFISESPGENFKNRDPYIEAGCLGEVSIKPVDNFKFGGGWGTLISAELLKKIPIPDSLGHYGLEDTYIMICSSFLKQKGFNIVQYVLENEVLVEDNKFRFSPYKKYLTNIDKREEFKKIAHENFQKELNKFGNLINN